MTGAMYSAISGLKAHMGKLNVIGNNIANANTYGYKSARTVFTESLYNSVRNGSNGSETMGGVNPSQIGYGASIGMIDLDMGTQSYVPTGRGRDCMISGDGFFFVGPKAEKIVDESTGKYSYRETDPKTLMLTRVGNFEIDAEGYLVDGNGYVVYGFVTCAGDTVDPDTGRAEQKTESGIAHKDAPAFSTQLVPIRLPLAAIEPENPAEDGAILGGTAIYPGVDATTGYNIYDPSLANETTTGKPVTVNVDSIKIDGQTGKIICTNNTDKEKLVLGYIPLAQVTNINGVTHVNGPYFKALEGSGNVSVASIGGILDGESLNNGKGDYANPIYGTGETVLQVGGLESSGTDIATEFSEMITTQRGYQANTRIVTVTDSMLEELVNMKR